MKSNSFKIKTPIFTLIWVYIFLLTFSTNGQSNFYLGGLNQTDWDNLINEINTKKSSLQSKIAQAEGQIPSLETSYAKVSLYTVNEFLIYAARDRQNAGTLQARYQSTGFSGFNNDFNTQITIERGSQVNFSVFHPFQQLYDCTKILNSAIIEIDKQLAGTIVLKNIPNFTTSGYPSLSANASYYKKDGNVIFPSSQWGLTADDTHPRQNDLMETQGYLGSLFHSPAQTTISGGKIVTTTSYATNEGTQLGDQLANNQTPTQIHFTHTNTSNWATLYPDIDDFKQTFIHYDIDYPNIKDINKSVIETFVPSIVNNSNGSSLVYVLSNEPRFDISQGLASQGVSNYTYNAYIEHLKTEYDNNINTLNTVYNPFNSNKNFSNFDELKTNYTIPLNRVTWQGTPIWYDWLRFNMNRSNRWHLDLKNAVLQSDANAKASIKILGRTVEDPIKDDGIDPESLMDIQDVIGFDNQVVPNKTHGRNNRFYKDYLNHYVMDWREQAITLDFAKSLHPTKPTFDSEWHAISSNAWDNFILDEGYTRSALWMAYTNGLSMMNCWWWYREANGDLQNKVGTTGNIMFSPQHQAIVFNEFGKTMKELNAHGNTISTLTPNTRDFLIYFSIEAAIQDYNYSQQLAATYEALKLMNVKVGFTTETKINNLGYTPKAIIIPPTLFIKDSSIEALNTFKTNNPSTNIVNILRGGALNFQKDEKGTPDASRVKTFLSGASSFNFTTDIFGTSGNGLIQRFRNSINIPAHPIDFKIFKVGTSNETFGVFASFGFTPENKQVLSLINLNLEACDISLPSSPSGYSNLLTGETISTTVTMKPYDVLLISNSTTLSNNSIKKIPESYFLYPNPVKNILTIKNTVAGNYSIYSLTGSLIITTESKNNVIQISVENLSAGVYFIEIPTEKGKSLERFIVIK